MTNSRLPRKRSAGKGLAASDLVRSIPLAGDALTVSTLEIAEFMGKLHKHVLRDWRRVAAAIGIDRTKFGLIYLDAQGREQVHYNLPRREYWILVSEYEPQWRARLYDRWEQLERERLQPAKSPPAPQLSDPSYYAERDGNLIRTREQILAMARGSGISREARKILDQMKRMMH